MIDALQRNLETHDSTFGRVALRMTTTVDLLTIWGDSSVATEVLVSLSASESTQTPRPPSAVPAAIPADQAYHWSAAWQVDIRESHAAFDAGDYVDFDSDDPNDIVRWFLSGN